MEHIVTSYIIPTITIVMSIMFYLSGKDSAKRADNLLKEITETTKGWQNDIMSSATKMLNSTPESAYHEMLQSKLDTANKMSQAIQSLAENISKNPKIGEEGEAQQKMLKMMLDHQFYYFSVVIDNKPIPSNNSQNINKIKKESEEKENKIEQQSPPVKQG